MLRVALDGELEEAGFTLTRRVGRVRLAAEVARAPRSMRPVLCADHRPVVV
jgi:hypothetical protein